MEKNRHRRRKKDRLVPHLLLAVVAVLVIFEGRLVVTMITHGVSMLSGDTADAAATAAVEQTEDTAAEPETEAPAAAETEGTPASPSAQLSSPVIVPESQPPVDDSYFADAAFIGDSRMEGFHNSSGITQGTFYTSVGMQVKTMLSKASIATAGGLATISDVLKQQPFSKIYIMLGTNDLGSYNWQEFSDDFASALEQITAIQPNATLYICSVIYVEENKVTTGNYVNNANVDKANETILALCEEKNYHYINLNEIFDNGSGALIEGATVDGVHLYEKYSKMMLDYLKNHTVSE